MAPHKARLNPLVEYDKVTLFLRTSSYYVRKYSLPFAIKRCWMALWREFVCLVTAPRSTTSCSRMIPFFCKSNPTSVTTLAAILRQYEELSGQRINLLKSSITFSAKTPPEVKQRVKRNLSIEAEGGIGKYLGLPEHFGRKKRDIFASIVDRIRQKAFSWTSRFLSGAGKQVLLEAVLSAMPCYAISCFKIPISLCKQIQSILTRFWWDANPEKRKMCWVAWDTLTQPKYAGGLGFRDIETFNDSLLAKIGWRLISNPESLLALCYWVNMLGSHLLWTALFRRLLLMGGEGF